MSVVQIGDYASAFEDPQTGKLEAPFFHVTMHLCCRAASELRATVYVSRNISEDILKMP